MSEDLSNALNHAVVKELFSYIDKKKQFSDMKIKKSTISNVPKEDFRYWLGFHDALAWILKLPEQAKEQKQE